MSAVLGRLPTVAEYMQHMQGLSTLGDEVYRYLNFHEIAEYKSVADKVLPVAMG